MYSYATWTEGGGQGKTSTAAALARAHVEQGLDTLVFDMDGQKGGFTSCYGLLEDYSTPSGDTVVDFLAGAESDDISDLIRTREGIDIVPRSPDMRDLDDELYHKGGPRQREVPDEQLRRVIEDYNLYEQYDMLITDVPGGIDKADVRNGLYATRNVLVPFNPSPKGELNLDGIVEVLYRYERRKDIDIGVIGLLPYNINEQLKVTKEVWENLDTRLEKYQAEADRTIPLAPVRIGERKALVDGAWNNGQSVFEFVDNQSRPSQRNKQTLRDFEKLADYALYQLSGGEHGGKPESPDPINGGTA